MKNIFFLLIVLVSLSSCSTGMHWQSVANSQLQFKRDDLEISQPITAEVKQTLIFGIDFKRLFRADLGTLSGETGVAAGGSSPADMLGAIPIFGTLLRSSMNLAKVQGYAVAKLMADNPGYDCVIYPKYTQKSKNYFGIVRKTTGKIEARLGKIK